MLVDDLLGGSARRSPDKVALVCGKQRVTYGELDTAVNRVACGLATRGLRRTGRVVIHLENGIHAVVAAFATLRAGGVIVPVNPTVKAAKLTHVLADSGATVVISERKALSVVEDALLRAPHVKAVVLSSLTEAEAQPMPDDRWITFQELSGCGVDEPTVTRVIDCDLAALIYTSGSTGLPKGVMVTHANMIAAADSISAYLGTAEDDMILNTLPLAFDYGLYQVLLAFHAGATLVLERSFAYPAVLLELIVRERVTALPIVPMLAALLLRQDLSHYDLSAVRYLTNTGAALPVAQIAALRQKLPHVRIFSMYGLTECKRVSYLDPSKIDERPASVGKPMDNVEVYVLDDEGRRLDSGTGELVVRGANVMQGYWNAPDETARVLRPGPIPGERVLHTGDLFRIDEEGYLHFVSRTDDVIKSRGQKVSPREVEDVLHFAPGVLEAAVIGRPDPLLGEAVVAYVTTRPDAAVTEQDLLRHCASFLEDIMVPRAIYLVAELPRTSSGKVARKELFEAVR